MGMPIISHLHGPHPIPVINNSQSEAVVANRRQKGTLTSPSQLDSLQLL